VDGEVQLRLKANSNASVTASGLLELREGGACWMTEGSRVIDSTVIQPDETATLVKERLEDDQGDWAGVKLEVTNTSQG
jgi:hypothetical protein